MKRQELDEWMKYHAWPPGGAQWLQTEAMRVFQKSYRNYRRGQAKGAKGEIFDVSDNTLVKDEPEENTIRETSIFQDTEDPQTIKAYKHLEYYRRAYHQFRSGSSKGAEGELSKIAARISADQIRLLPVAALARCLADQVRGSISVPESRFHCHLGAGKLGLGLVVPALVASGVPFAILQRPSEAWNSVLKSTNREIDLKINNTSICRLVVIRNIQDLIDTGFLSSTEPQGINTCGSSVDPRILPPEQNSVDVEKCRLLVLDASVNRTILLSSESFSCALGPAIKETITELGNILPANSGLDRPALYACENDHKAVDAIRDLVDAPLYVKECMVDRICSNRVIEASNISVVAEPYEGEIVVTARFPSAIPPAFGGSNVLKPKTTGAYSYLYQRKFLLVNGTHTTLAFMTLRQYCKDPAEAPGDYELLSPENIPTEAQEELRAWTAARCLVLLHSHEVDVIKVAQGAKDNTEVVEQLWEYANNTMKRFATVKDSTKRVLGGGVANRYETRLKDILDTLEAFYRSVPLASKLLAKAKFKSMVQLKNVLRKLVNDAEIFVTLRVESILPNQGAERLVEGYQKQFLH